MKAGIGLHRHANHCESFVVSDRGAMPSHDVSRARDEVRAEVCVQARLVKACTCDADAENVAPLRHIGLSDAGVILAQSLSMSKFGQPECPPLAWDANGL